MSTNYLALRSSAAVNLTLSTLTGSTITAPTLTVSTLLGSTMLGTTLALSTLTVSSINNNAPGTGTGSFSTLTVSSLVSVSSIQTASTMYTSSLVTTGSVGVGTTPGYALDVISSSQYVYTSFGQTWTTISGPPSAVWNGVAISATGQYQTAVYGSYSAASGVYYSNNYGSTWTAVTIPTSQQYQTVAMSASGQYQVTGVNGNGGKIYVSTDYGVTWNVVSSSYTGLWNGFGMSSTGQYMVGVLYYYSSFIGTIYYSSDYGVTWTQSTGLSSNSLLFTGVCCSGSGQYQTACANGSGLWYSTNYGASWTLSTSSGARVWVGACCSLSGQYQSACVLNGSIYYSSDYGVTWTSSGVANTAWQDICCDSTAQYQLCTVSTGKIWYSTNYGQSWTISNSATATWARPRMSRYGQYSIANVNNGTLYSSNLSAPTSLLTRFQSINDSARIVLDGLSGGNIIYRADGVSKWGIACISNNLQFLLNDSTSTVPVTFTSSGNVGIGTNAPVAVLDLYGSFRVLSKPYVALTSGTGIEFVYDGGGNLTCGTRSSSVPTLTTANMNYAAASHNFFIDAQGATSAMFINTSGQIGIGTTVTQNNKLRVFGGNANSGISLGDFMTTAGVKYIGMTAVSDGTNVSTSSGFSGITWGAPYDGGTSGYLAFHTHGYGVTSGERMRIDKDGRVGIGTVAPVGLLHVNSGTGTMPVLSAWNNQWSMFGGTGTTAQAVGIGFCAAASTFWNAGGQIIAVQPSTAMFPLNYYASVHNFYANTTATSPPSLVILANGNVGIGTSTPANLLTVSQLGVNYSSPVLVLDAGIPGNASAGAPRGIGKPLLGIGNSSWTGGGVSGDYYGIGFGWGGGTSGAFYPAEIGLFVQTTSGSTYGDLVFSTRSNTAAVVASERLRITSGGNVGIGTDVPLCRLMVNSFGNGVSTANWIAGAFGPSASLPRVVLGTYGSNAIIGAHSGALDAWANLTINPGGNVTITGTLSKGGGSFDIHHPLFTDAKKRLVHSFVEGPRCDLIYRGKTTLVNGTAMVDINKECTHSPECAMDDGTFEALCGNPQIFLQNNQSFDRVRGAITGSSLTITCENPVSIVIEWMVIAERVDPFIKKWDRTNSDGYLVTQYTMDHEPLNIATNYDSTV